jgi:hypothetical protein
MPVTNGQAQAYAAAIATFYGAVKAYFPTTMTYQVQSTYTVLDVVTGQVQGSLGYTPVPALVTGTGTGNGPGGTGARVYWHTTTISGRRLVRGATYLTPFTTAAWGTTDGIAPTALGVIQAGASAFLAACVTANVLPVIYHRPAKGTFVGGLAAAITGASLTAQPGSLRSRRS